MRYVLVAILVILFGYSLALVLQNGTELSVDLLFTQVPAMRLGLLLLITLALGLVLGLLLGVQVSVYSKIVGKLSDYVKILNTYAKSKFMQLNWLLLKLLRILVMKKRY